MSRSRRHDVDVEFVCVGECEDPPTYMVEGSFNVDNEFEPTSLDDMGSDMDCPECGERGEPTDSEIVVADV